MPEVHISELIPEPGERSLYFGTSRAGKSALMEWTLREVQRERPNCMTVIVDTKPRFRAEQAVGAFGRRIDARKMYASWEKGPVVPNSVVMDLKREKPFKGLWKNPGEIVIMQSGEEDDWLRMLDLLTAYCKAHIRERERLMMVDECLDFTNATPWAFVNEKTCSTAHLELVVNEESAQCSVLTGCMDCRLLSVTWRRVSASFISQTTTTCANFGPVGSTMLNPRTAIMSFGSGEKNREELSRSR